MGALTTSSASSSTPTASACWRRSPHDGKPRQSVVYYARDGDRLLISTESKRLEGERRASDPAGPRSASVATSSRTRRRVFSGPRRDPDRGHRPGDRRGHAAHRRDCPSRPSRRPTRRSRPSTASSCDHRRASRGRHPHRPPASRAMGRTDLVVGAGQVERAEIAPSEVTTACPGSPRRGADGSAGVCGLAAGARHAAALLRDRAPPRPGRPLRRQPHDLQLPRPAVHDRRAVDEAPDIAPRPWRPRPLRDPPCGATCSNSAAWFAVRAGTSAP